MRSTIRIAALALVLAALAVLPAGTELRAHSPGSATLIDLTVTADGGTAQTLVPAFHPVDDFYTVWVANSVSQVTIAGTPDGDGIVTYQYTDADTATDGHQVNLPTLGPKSISVVVSHTDDGPFPLPPATQIYTVRVIREGTVATDRAALMALYNSAGGSNWGERANWGSTEPLNTWDRVTTDSNGRVVVLGLGANNLVGTVPAALGNLDQMTWLYLWGNQLTGAIPGSLGNLANLQHLYLSSSADVESRLSGSIPAALGDLTNLTDLSLWGNQLTGEIPDSLGNLASLRVPVPGRQPVERDAPGLTRVTSPAWLQLSLWDNDSARSASGLAGQPHQPAEPGHQQEQLRRADPRPEPPLQSTVGVSLG